MSKPVTQLAIVGLGRIAEVQLMALGHVPDLRLVAGADSNALRKAVLPPGTRFVTNSAELFAASDIDAVVISTPLSSHYAVAATALSYGKHVLLEKPATQDTRQLGDLIGMARRKRLTLVVAFHAAFAKDLMWFRESHGAEIMERHGELRAIRCSFFDPHLNNGDAAQAFDSYGGSWIDSGVNALSVVDRLIGVHTVNLTDKFLTRLSGYPVRFRRRFILPFPCGQAVALAEGASIRTGLSRIESKRAYILKTRAWRCFLITLGRPWNYGGTRPRAFWLISPPRDPVFSTSMLMYSGTSLPASLERGTTWSRQHVSTIFCLRLPFERIANATLRAQREVRPMPGDASNEFDAETTRLYYETVKAELQLRLQLRDNAATMYLGTIAVVLALGLETMNALLFLVPPIALSGATMATHHNISIGYLSWYCASVDDFLHASGRKTMVAWDRSEAYQDYAPRSRLFALLTHILFFVMPTGVAILYVGSILCRQTVITDSGTNFC